MDKKEEATNESHTSQAAIYLMKEEEGKRMLAEGDESDIVQLVKELQASLKRNDMLEKENHDLLQEIHLLKAQVSNLKAHDNERKSILWKKLHNSCDVNNLDGSNYEMSQEVKNPNTKPIVQESAATKPPTLSAVPSMDTKGSTAKATPTLTPPPPPPPPSRRAPGKKTVRRVPEVVELYRALTRRESRVENKTNNKGILSPTFSRSMIGEIENRSKYLSAIRSDIERHKDHIHFLIDKVESAAHTDISEVETFVKWLDEELSSLVDERAVLKHFPRWPERKADALREAAFNYRGLRNLESEVLSFKDNPKEPLTQALQRIQTLQDRLEERINSIERIRESTSKRYSDFHIPWDWMLDTGFIGQLKYSSLRLAQEYMKRITKEVEGSEAPKEGNLMLQGVRFAYGVHQFAGGFDGETIRVFNELKKIRASGPRR